MDERGRRGYLNSELQHVLKMSQGQFFFQHNTTIRLEVGRIGKRVRGRRI
jgi:hypothetical protein